MVLGIIGEAGVGKTSAASFFATVGAYVISADLIVKYLYQLPETKEMILQKCGKQFLNDDDTINFLSLRKYAFENYQFLKKLERIIWPKMVENIIAEINQVQHNQDQKLIILDCAVLFNAQLDYLVDQVLLITADEALKIKRIKERDKVSDDEAKALLRLQKKHLILDKKIDFIVQNNGSTKDFVAQLTNLVPRLMQENKKT